MTYVTDLPNEGTVTEYCIIFAHSSERGPGGRHVWSLFSAGERILVVLAIQHN